MNAIDADAQSVLTWLKRHSTKATLDGMARYAIPPDKALGVDRTPHAWTRVSLWSGRRNEFEKRTAFALLWSLSVHDKRAGNEPFLDGLALIEREATDDRHFVRKAVNMALRAIGKRNRVLNTAAVAVARRLAGSEEAAPRWVGRDALRELTSPGVAKRLEK